MNARPIDWFSSSIYDSKLVVTLDMLSSLIASYFIVATSTVQFPTDDKIVVRRDQKKMQYFSKSFETILREVL